MGIRPVNTESASHVLQPKEGEGGGAADMTRRMICGGLAGMIAKVK